MSNQKKLGFPEILIKIGLMIIIVATSSIISINILKLFKEGDIKTNLFHDSLTLIDHIGTDFKFVDNSFNPWTNLVFNEQFVLLPRLKNSFWFYKKGAEGKSYKVSYYLNGSGELLRNGKLIANNIDRLSLILRKNISKDSSLENYSLFFSLNSSQEVSSTQNITLSINNSVKEMTINIISEPINTPIPAIPPKKSKK
ncbi:MAG: hypothetical protein HYU63_00685 [Armatimonadetes bacterium]|nr:hypothetical protein [Armatimonadota bacterium]